TCALPILIDQYEAGIKNDFFNGKLSANLTWYRIQNNKFAQTIIEADGTVKDPNMKEFTGKTASDGVELDLTGKLAEGLNVMAGYSYIFMRFLDIIDIGNVDGVSLYGTCTEERWVGSMRLSKTLVYHIYVV